MTEMVLTQSRVREGVWEGILTGHVGRQPPQLRAHYFDQVLEDLQLLPVEDDGNSWWVKLKIPSASINDGVQSFVIENADDGEKLAQFSILVGPPLDDHVIADVALLRAELDMLKRAFRRHCNNQE